MTRINIIEPSELTDQHLIAEYREIFMVGGSLRRTLKSKSGYQESKVPKNFTLNNGHVYFFYNKGKYLHERYLDLVNEMKSRGMRPDPERQFKKEQWPSEFYKDWEPNEKDIELIRKRIKEKINKKPGWYRWTNRIGDETSSSKSIQKT